MAEKVKFIPTEILKITPVGENGQEMTFNCGSPYQDSSQTIPHNELAIRKTDGKWSKPQVLCNQLTQNGKCKLGNWLISFKQDKAKESNLQDCPWIK